MIGQMQPAPGRGGAPAPSGVPRPPAPGVGPELAASNTARNQSAAALNVAGIVSDYRGDGRPGRWTTADLGNPQQMPDRPEIRLQMGDIDFDLTQAWAQLPGRRGGVWAE